MKFDFYIILNGNSKNYKDLATLYYFLRLEWNRKFGLMTFPSIYSLFHCGSNFNLFLGCKEDIPISQISDFFNEKFDVVCVNTNENESNLILTVYKDFHESFGSLANESGGNSYVLNTIRKQEVTGLNIWRIFSVEFLSYFFGEFFVPFYFNNKKFSVHVWRRSEILAILERYARHFFFVQDITYCDFCFHLTVNQKLMVYLIFQADSNSFNEIQTTFDKSVSTILKDQIIVKSSFLLEKKLINSEKHIFDLVLSDFVKESYISDKDTLSEQYKSVLYRLHVDSRYYLRGQYSAIPQKSKQYLFFSTNLLTKFRIYVSRKIESLKS